jgi:putative chitinase
MARGWFTRKKLADFVPQNAGSATRATYTAMRRIINGTDKAALIAAHADAFEDALIAGGWRA